MTTVPRKPHSPRKHALTSGLGALGLGALLGLSLAQPALGWSVEEAAAPHKGSELKVGIAFVPAIEGPLPLMREFGEKTGSTGERERCDEPFVYMPSMSQPPYYLQSTGQSGPLRRSGAMPLCRVPLQRRTALLLLQ